MIFLSTCVCQLIEHTEFMVILTVTSHYWMCIVKPLNKSITSLNKNIGKVRIPSVFNNLLKPNTQLEQPHSSIPPPKGGTLFISVFQHKRQLTLHTFLISIYNRSLIPMFTPFKLQDN